MDVVVHTCMDSTTTNSQTDACGKILDKRLNSDSNAIDEGNEDCIEGMKPR